MIMNNRPMAGINGLSRRSMILLVGHNGKGIRASETAGESKLPFKQDCGLPAACSQIIWLACSWQHCLQIENIFL